VGVASDVLHYDVDGVLWVNEQRIGLPQPCTRCQQPLHKIEPGLIPSGFVFVAGTHPRSFDSRYQEVGLIAIERLEGLVIPLWKFKDRVDHEL
jgi:conjugal transfer pilin signal peptidase TrbI